MKELKPVKVPPKNLYKSALANLKAAWAILRNRKRWTQGYPNVDCNGQELANRRSDKSIAFCALGAVQFVNGPGEKKATVLLRNAALEVLRKEHPNRCPSSGNSDIFNVNDYSGDEDVAYENVRLMFKKAIKAAKGK